MATLSRSISTTSCLLSLLLVVLHLSSLTAADPLYSICGNTGNFTANSTYQSNLNRVLLTLASDGPPTGFTKTTVGQIPDRVHGLVLCRGDVKPSECRSCIDTASQDALQICPFNKAVSIWYDPCFLRFSNVLQSSTDNSQSLILGNTANVTDISRFDDLRGMLLDKITAYAVNSAKKFATGEVSKFTSEFPIVYGLVQCTPDLSRSDCERCLRPLFDPLPTFLEGRRGGRVIGDRCSMRYEVYSFFEGAPTLKLTAPPPPKKGN